MMVRSLNRQGFLEDKAWRGQDGWGKGLTGTNDSPHSQHLRIPAIARLGKVPELCHGLTLHENEDECEGEEDELAGHEEVEQPAGPSFGHANAIDEKANGELAESQA